MNKYQNPSDTIGVEPSGIEVKMPDLHNNETFTSVLNQLVNERKAAKEKILSDQTPMPSFDEIQTKLGRQHPMQNAPARLPLSPRYTSDASVTAINVFRHRLDEFTEDETIEGCAILIESLQDNYAAFNGVYLMKGPTTHEKLRSAIRCDAGIPIPSAEDNFADRGYIHGFYTNKGNFINRRQAVWLIGENDLPTAVPKGEINSHTGAMSTDIWNEDGSPPRYDSRNTITANVNSQRFQVPTGSRGVGHISTKPIERPKDGKGKVLPKKASEMMAEKRIKKKDYEIQ